MNILNINIDEKIKTEFKDDSDRIYRILKNHKATPINFYGENKTHYLFCVIINNGESLYYRRLLITPTVNVLIKFDDYIDF